MARVLLRPSGIAACLVAAILLSGCGTKTKAEDEASVDAGPPPPSPYTLSLDLSVTDGGTNLEAQEPASLRLAPRTPRASATYHTAAAVVVVAVNVQVALPLLVPVALLNAAARSTPQLVAENTYVWSFTATAAGRTYTANLTGTFPEGIRGATRGWTMKVTTTPEDSRGCCTAFTLFDGTTTGDGRGSWQIYDPTSPKDAAKLFSIAYDAKSATQKSLVYTVNSARSAQEAFGAGSTVAYTATADSLSVTVKDSFESGSTILAWKRATKEGSITEKNGSKHCWDTQAAGFADLASCP